MLHVSSELGKQASCELNTYEQHYYDHYTNTAVFDGLGNLQFHIRYHQADSGGGGYGEEGLGVGIGGCFQYCRHLVL